MSAVGAISAGGGWSDSCANMFTRRYLPSSDGTVMGYDLVTQDLSTKARARASSRVNDHDSWHPHSSQILCQPDNRTAASLFVVNRTAVMCDLRLQGSGLACNVSRWHDAPVQQRRERMSTAAQPPAVMAAPIFSAALLVRTTTTLRSLRQHGCQKPIRQAGRLILAQGGDLASRRARSRRLSRPPALIIISALRTMLAARRLNSSGSPVPMSTIHTCLSPQVRERCTEERGIAGAGRGGSLANSCISAAGSSPLMASAAPAPPAARRSNARRWAAGR